MSQPLTAKQDGPFVQLLHRDSQQNLLRLDGSRQQFAPFTLPVFIQASNLLLELAIHTPADKGR